MSNKPSNQTQKPKDIEIKPEMSVETNMEPTKEQPLETADIAESTKPNRVFGINQEIDTDTYKLEVSAYKRNLSWEKKQKPSLIDVEHCHFYHSFDSSGKKMDKCNHVGGHAHHVVTEVDEKGDLIGTCGPAIGGFPGGKGVPADKHIHKVRYIKSDKTQRRRYNEEAQKHISAMSQI